MTLNIAHRGFSGSFPENTMLAFEKALEAGADGIEFDVHLTKDGVPVIIHDEFVDRTTDGKGPVGDYTLAELRQLDASADFPGVYGKNQIPTLEEYFRLIEGQDILTNIELKTGVIWYERLEERVLEVIHRFHHRENVLISSFNHRSVLKMRGLAPDMAYAFLEESRLIDPADYLCRYAVDYYHPLWNNMTAETIFDLKQRDITVNVWTVNTGEEMRAMLELGVDGVITNFPDLFNRVRAEFAS